MPNWLFNFIPQLDKVQVKQKPDDVVVCCIKLPGGEWWVRITPWVEFPLLSKFKVLIAPLPPELSRDWAGDRCSDYSQWLVATCGGSPWDWAWSSKTSGTSVWVCSWSVWSQGGVSSPQDTGEVKVCSVDIKFYYLDVCSAPVWSPILCCSPAGTDYSATLGTRLRCQTEIWERLELGVM